MIRPEHSYLIFATPRSGSTLLCELLKDTGVAGQPEEYFEAKADTGVPAHPGDYLGDLPPTGAGIRDDSTPPRAPEHSSLLELSDYGAHLERTLELGTGPGGVFGAKLMWRHLSELQTLASRYRPEYGELDRHELLRALFSDPRYVWVTRRDKVRQAISLWRALQTRNWRLQHADDDSEAELHYSFKGIDHLVRELTADDAGWAEFFDAHAIAVEHIFYEDHLERDRGQTVRTVLEHIGVSPPPDWRPAEMMQRQADSLTEEWVAAYHRDATRDDAARDDAAVAR